MKINRKGFTLIELLAVIVIIGLVTGLVSYGIIELYKSSKDKSFNATIKGVEKAAISLSNEASSIEWHSLWTDSVYEYYCTSFAELKNKGLLKKDVEVSIDDAEKQKYTNYIAVERNKATKVINDTIFYASKNVESEEEKEWIDVCKGIIGKEFFDKKPTINSGDTYTDTIVVKYNIEDNPQEETEEAIEKKKINDIDKIILKYGNKEESINYSTENITGEFVIKKLNNNTNYNIDLCLRSPTGQQTCTGVEHNYWTKDFEEQNITSSKNPSKVEINFNDSNIYGEVGKHYFKLELTDKNGNITGTSNVNVQECDSKYNVINNSPTTTIESGKWYKVMEPLKNEKVIITYNTNSSITGNGYVRIEDDKGNNDEKSSKINIDAEKINIQYISNSCGTNVPAIQSVNAGDSVNLSSTKPSKTGYIFKSWNTKSDGTGTNYNPGQNVTISSDLILYAKCSPITYTIQFNGNGNTGQTYYTNGTWAVSTYTNPSINSDKTVFTSGYKVKYDEAYTLPINRFTKTGYTFSGWATTSTGTVSYNNGASVKNLMSTNNGTKTLYAKWSDSTAPTLSVNLSTGTTYCAGKKLTLTCSDSGSGMKSAVMVDNGSTSSGTSTTSQTLSTSRSGNIATKLTCTDKSGNTTTKTYYYTVVPKTSTSSKAYDTCPSGYSTYSGGSYKCRKLTQTNATCSKKCSSITTSSSCNSYSKCKWYTYMTALSGTSFCGPTGYASAAAAAGAGDVCASYSCSSGTLNGTKCDSYSYSNYTRCSSGWTASNGKCTKTVTNSCTS